MQKTFWPGVCLFFATWLTGSSPSYALPGESVQSVEAWIQANPTLRPSPGEKLAVNRTDTPAQRFTFQASIFPVSGVALLRSNSIVRTERFSLFDLINEIDGNRMEESLRDIYGPHIYTDYRRATLLYSYPSPDSTAPVNPNAVLQGEVRQGDQYAYWLETAADQTGQVYSARMAIFLKEDLPALLSRLGNPESP